MTIPKRIRGKWLGEPRLIRVLAVLNASGETRITGGAVRNALMGRPVREVDLATTLDPLAVVTAAEEAGLAAHPTGIDHGTVTVVAEGRPFEVTTLRRDVETFGRRARVAFTSDWEADARRRDFTINALYCSADGRVHDPLGGCRDIERRHVRFVGRPADRIREDHLRILRFFRFNAEYATGRLDRDGLASSVRLRKLLRSLSGERVRQESLKLLAAEGATRVLKTMIDTRVAGEVFGRKLDLKPVDRMSAIDRTLRLEPDPLLRLELLTGDATALRDALKLTNAELHRLEAVHSAAPPSPELRPRERRVVLYQLGRQAFVDAARIAFARSGAKPGDSRWKALIAFARRSELPAFQLKGRDLLDLGYSQGPEIGRILKALEDWWIAAGFPSDKKAVLERARAIAAPTREERGQAAT